MLCLICNEDVFFQGNDIKCAKCKEHILHFSCAGMREVNFRKLAKPNKDKWCCAKCNSMVFNTSNSQDDDYFVGSNEILSNLTDSVKCTSESFDNFGK